MALRPYVWLMLKASARHFDQLDERPVEIRRREELQRTPVLKNPTDGLVVEDFAVPVEGGSIAVRSYRPDVAGVLPLHLYAHGGSFWSGNLAQVEPMARLYASIAQCRVLNIDYRLAPEHPWPTAANDYFAVLEWASANAVELAVELDRVSVGGVSCGATLAAVSALTARDRGGPRVMFQLLEIPGLDMTQSQPSMRTFGRGYVLTAASLKQGYDYYLPPGVDRRAPHVSPLLADDLSGLPAATIFTCEYDPLRDDGEAYAQRLRAAGVAAEVIRAKGHIHGSTYSASPWLPSARTYQRRLAQALREAYATR